MKITNNHNLPQALIDYLQSTNQRHNEPNCYSATTILKPTRMIILTERHFDEIEKDGSEMINMLFGTATHEIMEKFDKTGFAETSHKVEIKDGYYLTGKLDLLDKENREIIDWKTATTFKIKKQDFADWKKQGFIYSWLVLRSECNVINKATFYALLKDWSPKENRLAKFKGEFYPETQVYPYSFAISTKDLNDTQEFIENKFNELILAQTQSDDDLPKCSDDDTWYTGDVWAVYNGAKCVKLCQSENEAKEYIKNNPTKAKNYQFRQGEHRRCMDYCECNKFCKYYKEYKEKEGK